MKLITDQIIEEITNSLGLNYLPEEERNEILTRTLELISKRAGLRIVEGFNDEKAEEFGRIPEDDLEQMEYFMMSNNPEAGDIFRQEAEKVKNEILSARIEDNKSE